MVFNILDELEAVKEYYMTVVSQNEMSDEITVYASLKNELSDDAGVIQNALQARLRVRPDVVIVDADTLQIQVYRKKSRKPVRFIDRR